MKKKLFVLGCVSFFLVFSVVFFSCVSVVKAVDRTSVSIGPVNQTVFAEHELSINVTCSPQQPVKGFELKVSFDPSLLEAKDVLMGDFFDEFTTNKTFFNDGIINNTAGTILNIFGLILGMGNVTHTGVLVTIHFIAKSTNGTSQVRLGDVGLTNESYYITDLNVSSGIVTVTGGSSQPPDTPPVVPPDTPPSSENTPPAPPIKPVGLTLIKTGAMHTFYSTASDSDGDLVRLRFDWGDGALSNWTDYVVSNTTVSASHAWMNISNTTIRVIAQDATGENSSWSDPLMIMISQNRSGEIPPVGMFTVPENASSNQTIVFDTSGIYDPDGMIVSYQWDFGDGATGVGENPAHTYQSPGEFTVTLIVIDSAGVRVTLSKVVNIAAGSGAGLETENNFLPSNIHVIVLVAMVLSLFVLFVVFWDSIEKFFVEKQIQISRRRLAQFGGYTADINQIIDELFFELNQKVSIPTKDSILGAYRDLMMTKIEENAAFRPPAVSIDEIERLVDRLIQSKIEEEVDNL